MRFSALAVAVVLYRVESGAAFVCQIRSQNSGRTCPPTDLRASKAIQDLEDNAIINVMNVDEQVSLEEYTDKILGGDFEDDYVANYLPILQSWCKRETVEGAETTQKILYKMEESTENGVFAGQSLRANFYAIAVNAWAKSGHEKSAEMAQAVFDRMVERGVESHRVVYNCLLQAYCIQNDAEKVAETLRRMEEEMPEQILTSDYNVLISTYARQGNATAAEKVVKRMIDHFNDEKSDCLPDLVTYNIILDAWAKSDSQNCGSRAEMILDAIETEERFAPDIRSYVSAMTAIIRSREKQIVERVEIIWNRARSRGIGDDSYVYSNILDSYAVADASNAAAKVENILQMADKLDETISTITVVRNAALKVFKESRDNGVLTPAEKLFERMVSEGTVDLKSYTTMIAIYGNQMESKAIQDKAMEIEMMMKKCDVSRTTAFVNCMIHFWVRQGDIGRATRLLDEMEQAYRSGNIDLAPDVVSYTTIMSACVKCKDQKLAEETFQRQKAMVESGNQRAEPNFITHVALLEGMAKSKEPKAAQRVESLVREMYRKYENGESSIKPNAQVISLAIHCWSKSGDRDAGERAEGLLNWMIELYESEGTSNFEPNKFAFSSAIAAWAKSRKFGKVRRAKALLDKMTSLYESGRIKARPNDYCYTSVINACGFCENDTLEKRDALAIFVDVYKHMMNDDDETIRPSQVTFTCSIGALQKLLPPGDDRTAAVTKVFTQCLENGMCDHNVINKLRYAVQDATYRELVGPQIAILERQVILSDIPPEWKQNLRR